MNQTEFPYPSRRVPVYARNVVATSQPLAVQAGINALCRGGNAVDAALAAAITLTVVEPTSNGIGSDAFAIVWDGNELHGLNASGRSPAAWTPEYFSKYKEMPKWGWDAVTIPGAVSAWAALSEQFGRLAFEDLFDAAIRYARHGYHVSPITAAAWAKAHERYTEFAEFNRVFCPNGRAPRAGELFKCEEQAQTLEEIASSHGESFYRGRLAEKIAAAAKAQGGAITADDLAAHQPQWVSTVSGDWKNHRLHEIPPNGQGIAAIMALGILEHTPLAEYPVDSPDSIHIQIEAMKLAFADAYNCVADPDCMRVKARELLDPDYLKSRAALIRRDTAGNPVPGLPREKGTVYLTAADESGMMVSFIQSNFWGFGSGVVVPGTGISLQNRGYGFNLIPGHPNQIGPNKRPFHTIIPAFVMGGIPNGGTGVSPVTGNPEMSFGVMGGSFQAQGHMQMMVRIFLYGQNPQAASDAPRWRVEAGNKLLLEDGFNITTADELARRGHNIEFEGSPNFGGAQIIRRIDKGYTAASDHRKDGLAAGF